MINFKEYINESNIDKIKKECKDIDPNINYSSSNWEKEFIDNVNWEDISWKQNLSESFIEKYKDYIYWNHISWSQKLSEKFIEKYKDKIYFNELFDNRHLSNEFILNHIQWFINENINKDSWRLENKEFKDKFYKYKKLFGI